MRSLHLLAMPHDTHWLVDICNYSHTANKLWTCEDVPVQFPHLREIFMPSHFVGTTYCWLPCFPTTLDTGALSCNLTGQEGLAYSGKAHLLQQNTNIMAAMNISYMPGPPWMMSRLVMMTCDMFLLCEKSGPSLCPCVFVWIWLMPVFFSRSSLGHECARSFKF